MDKGKNATDKISDPPVSYVTQEMWDEAQAALQAVLPLVEAHVPPLSTSGTAIELRNQVRKALRAQSSMPPKPTNGLSDRELYLLTECTFSGCDHVGCKAAREIRQLREEGGPCVTGMEARRPEDNWHPCSQWKAQQAEIERLRAALEKIAGGDPSQVYSPIGPLHAAGIVFQWEIDAKIAREALAGQSPSEPNDARPRTLRREEAAAAAGSELTDAGSTVKSSAVLDHRFLPDGMDPGICQKCGSTRTSHRDQQ